MKDIAKDLRVSVVTVSRALRNDREVSSATRACVLKRARELNYRPNLAARALVTGRTNLIGLIVPTLAHSFFSELASGMSAVLRRSGFSLVIASSEEDPKLEQQEIDHLLARGVDALLIASTQQTVESFHRVSEHKIPYILLDRWIPGIAANFVGVNDEVVGCTATEHLIDIGCCRIAHISATQVSTARGRLTGYKKTLVRHGIPIRPEYIVNASHLDKSATTAGYAAAVKLLELEFQPDGIFCCNDPVAVGAMAAIQDAGLRIPEDIALIGCGNLHFDGILRTPLSSVDQRSEMIGRRSAELSIRLLSADNRPRPKAILLEPTLVIRDSTKRVAHSGNSK
jgi:LacI family transcriptional regulator